MSPQSVFLAIWDSLKHAVYSLPGVFLIKSHCKYKLCVLRVDYPDAHTQSFLMCVIH